MRDGWCDSRFTGVQDVFAAAFAAGDELGAAVCVYVDGECVVDLWGGVADERTGRPWQRDTACVTFSCTKALTATAALLVAERRRIPLDGRVVEWWPEFGRHGKDATTLEDLLTHRAGLPAFDRPVSADEATDPAAMARQLASQAPEWQPGTDHGYHALTFGWLVGEFVRRHTGQTVGQFARADISPDLWVGVRPDMVEDLARISAGRPMRTTDPPAPHDLIVKLVAASQDPNSPKQRSEANPAASFNNPVLLTAGWPAAGLVCTARALAGFYARLVGGRIVQRATLRDAIRERVRGPDRTLVTETAFAAGFMRASSNMWLPEAARSAVFGHPGASGALGLADPERKLAFAYIPNLTRPALGDRRAYRLVEAVYAALEG